MAVSTNIGTNANPAGLILSSASLVLGFGLAWLDLALHPETLEWHFKWS